MFYTWLQFFVGFQKSNLSSLKIVLSTLIEIIIIFYYNFNYYSKHPIDNTGYTILYIQYASFAAGRSLLEMHSEN